MMAMNTITHIVKRNGSLVLFDQERITNAIYIAQLSLKLEDRSLARRLSDIVISELAQAYSSESPPTVEDIQDIVVNVLYAGGCRQVATAYREYRAEHARLREEKNEQIVVNDTIPYKILWQVFTWNVAHECDSVDRLNAQVRDGRVNQLIEDAEALYHADVDKLTERVIKRGGEIRIIIIAGPSSSGKTTTTLKMTERFNQKGIEVVALNLDNYFKDLETHPKDEFDDYDFERPEALDLELINEHLADLMKGRAIQTPIYNFKTGKREKTTVPFSLKPNQMLLLDSLHGLYKPMTSSVPDDFKFKLYIEALCQIRDNKGEFVRWADLRMLRRMVRDNWHRHYQPDQTVGHWHYVRRSEMKYIVPYIGQADHIINGSLPYELIVHRKHMFGSTQKIVREYENQPTRLDAYIRAKRIHDLLATVEPIRDEKAIPHNSLMREYIGGSIYKY
ncbi:MAG: ATP cone domain-containing protein [bacterium]|nr:ATP cone domain-containing protein [Candidatus Sumerlaeota bacterium]